MRRTENKKKWGLCSLLVFAVWGVLGGCASQQLTQADQTYLSKVKSHPTEFMLSKSDGEAAWGRANLYLAKYSQMKMQTASDLLLDTYNPKYPHEFGYSISRATIKDSMFFNVQCNGVAYDMFHNWKEDADLNAHMCAYYMAAGEIKPLLIKN